MVFSLRPGPKESPSTIKAAVQHTRKACMHDADINGQAGPLVPIGKVDISIPKGIPCHGHFELIRDPTITKTSGDVSLNATMSMPDKAPVHISHSVVPDRVQRSAAP